MFSHRFEKFFKIKTYVCYEQAKLRDARGMSSSGWRLDPYKERNVAGNGTRKKKST